MDKFCKDIEMDNELQSSIFDKLELCDKNINSDSNIGSLAPTTWAGNTTGYSDARPKSAGKIRSPRAGA